MSTDKKRVQGYLSDTAYQYLENYRIENGLKSQSLALEKLLESLAIKGSSGDLESESYSKLKSELKSDLISELSEMINRRLGIGNNTFVPTHDSLTYDVSSDSQDSEVLPAFPDIQGQDGQTDQSISPDFLKTLEGHFCLAEVFERIPYFWDSGKRNKSKDSLTLYATERSAKTSLSKIQKQGTIGLKVWELGAFFERLDPSYQLRLVPFLEKAIERKG